MGTAGSNDDVTAVFGEALADDGLETPVGRPIGRYFVIGELGRGGMGLVVRAYDPKLQREVALKILRTSAMTKEAGARMVREARAMAKLSHPNVVAVYDVDEDPKWGTVVAMEYVAGTTLKAWARKHRSEVRAIVEAYVQAGRGLGMAHAAGLLHRDFKPDNVLLGDDGRARVTDFGLARVDVGGRDSTMSGTGSGTGSATGSGIRPLSLPPSLTAVDTVLGTPRYMAPEQHGAEPLTPAADQFAFCVSMWESLTGMPPYVASSLEALVERKHDGPPPWPKDVAVPRAVVEAIRRGLWAVPEDRFPSMLALIDALEAAYSSQRRKRVAIASGAALVALGATVILAWPEPAEPPCSGARDRLGDAWDDARRQAVREAIEGTGLSYALTTWDSVGPALDAYADGWAQQHTEACEATNVRGDQSVAMLDLRIGCLQGARRELAAATELLARADAAVVERAGDLVAALPALSRCADVERLSASVPAPPPEQAEAVEAARAELAKAQSLGTAGKYDEALAVLQPLSERAAAIGHAPLVTEVRLGLGKAYDRLGRYEEAETELTEALHSAVELGQWDEAASAGSALVMVVGNFRAQTQRGLGVAIAVEGLAARSSQPALREAELRRVVGRIKADVGDHPSAIADLRRALALLEQAPEADPLDLDSVRMTLAAVLLDAGELADAEREQAAVVTLRLERLGPEHPRTGNARHNLANVLAARGDLPGAEREYRAALAVMRATLGERHPSVGMARNNLGGVLEDLGRLEEAVAELEAVVEIFREAYGPDHPNVAGVRHNLALQLGAQGRNAEAAEELRAVIASLTRTAGADHPMIEMARMNLGIDLAAMGRIDEAVAETRLALDARIGRLEPGHLEIAEARIPLARLLLDAGRAREALPETEAAWSIYAQGKGTPARRGDAAFMHARALRGTGAPPDQVDAAARAAIEIHREAQAENAARRVQAWLDGEAPSAAASG